MKQFVIVPKIEKGVITNDDQTFFKNIKIFFTEDGRTVISFDCENMEYFAKWSEKVNASPIGDSKNILRLTIEQSVGDSKDRISDNFKMTQMLFIMMLEFYKFLSDTSGMDPKVKDVFEVFKKLYDSGDQIFNIQLKASYSDEMKKLFDREIAVVDFIKTSSENVI